MMILKRSVKASTVNAGANDGCFSSREVYGLSSQLARKMENINSAVGELDLCEDFDLTHEVGYALVEVEKALNELSAIIGL